MSVKFKSIFRTALIMCLLLVVGNLSAQTTAKGTVTDQTGEPVIGATVVEKGNPKNAAVTDFDGNFTLKLQNGKTVVISYIGMVTQEVTAGPNMQIKLLDDNASLEEVVVVGYTSKARKDLTGSVGSISGAKLAVVPVTSAAVALQGKISGVQVTTVDGQPGADVNIRVRGGTSVTQENHPLFIVDGFQVDNINDIPPSDIASIDVLKDASLTAIYGAKGGNGVVVVTTKSAKEGKVQVTFNGDLKIEGEITQYNQRNKSVSSEGYSAQTELSMTVNVRFTNNKNHKEDFEKQFTASTTYETTQSLNSVQEELVTEMVKNITDQIFNATVANW